MKEKIAEVIRDAGNWACVCDGDRETAAQILTLISGEIEKVEYPEIPMEAASVAVRQYIRRLYEYYQVGNLITKDYEDLVRASGIIQADIEIALSRGAFEECRQKILKLLEE